MPAEETVLNKLGEIPVINDGWSTAAEYYSKMKEYNALTRLTLNVAESSVKIAGHISSPVLSHYQPQIENINDYACKKIDELESKYPVIKQPTDQLKETYVEPVFGKVKPVITQVQGIVDNGKQKIVNLKTASVNMVEEAKTLGVGTVTHVFNTTFESSPGRFVTRTVDSALDMADGLVDKYLPESDKCDKTDVDSDNSSSDGEESSDHDIEKMQEMDPTPKRVIIHASCVTEKLRRRMYRLAIKDLTYAKARATIALTHLQSTVTLIDYAKKNMNNAKEKVDDMWTEIVKESDGAKEKTVFEGTVEDRIIAIGRIVARQVEAGVMTFEKANSEFCHFRENPISKSKEYLDLIQTFVSLESIQNISSQSLAKARESLQMVQEKIQTIVKNASTDWLAMDIDMENIPMDDGDIGIEQVVSSNNNSEDEVERESFVE